MKIKWFFLLGLMCFCIPIVIYFFKFNEFTISDNPTDWGVFGDYIGGVLNPFFAIINIIIFIYLTQVVSKFDDQRSKQALISQRKITLSEFRQRELKELAKILDGVIENMSTKIGHEKTVIALYKVKTIIELNYLFPILKEPENIKIVNDLTPSLNGFIDFHVRFKKNHDVFNKDEAGKLFEELAFQSRIGAYVELKTKLIQALQKYIIDDLDS